MNISLRNVHQSCTGTNGEFSIVKWPWNLKVKVKHIKNHENHLLNRKSYRFLVGCKMFLIEGRMRYVVSVLTYNIKFYVTWLQKIHKLKKIFVSSNRRGQRSRSRSNKDQKSRSYNCFHYFGCYHCDTI